jgi:signal transduction histidine kinase/CheY-like chemotaxis protein
MSLSELKSNFVNQRIQQLEVSEEGNILDSDDAIFKIPKKSRLASLHPFLEGVQHVLPSLSNSVTFPCVNLEIGEKKKIVDIEIVRKKEKIYLLIFDFTEHYEDSHPLVQEKNESTIAKNKLSFEKHLLQAKEEFKNNFLANLNHEIRNPLNNMLGFVDLLVETKLNYDQHELIKIVRKTGKHIKQLMDDMLDISKIERGTISVRHVNFYLTSIISSLQQHFSLKYETGKVAFEVEVAEKMPKTFIGDPVRLNQILFNLLENAFRNTSDGVVKLKIHSEEIKGNKALIHFEISDTGLGIPQDELDKVFETYYQLKLDNEKPIGEGIGLKIVKDLVDLLEGSIKVISKPDKGSSFICSIPFVKRKSARERKTVRKGSGIFHSKRILVVEDEPTNQMLLMKTFLNNDKGYVMEIANNGTQALELLENRKYDLVMIKNKYPDMSGTELIREIEGHVKEEIVGLPILMATGSTMPAEKEGFNAAGASLVLPKPYSKKELFRSIEKLIR